MATASYDNVAEFLAWAIHRSGKTQRQVAVEVGYPKPNVVSMMKTGETKIPIDKVPDFAQALDVDTAFFLRMVLEEYYPEIYAVISASLGTPLSANERAMLHCYRSVAPEDDLEMDGEMQGMIQLSLSSRRFHLEDLRKR